MQAHASRQRRAHEIAKQKCEIVQHRTYFKYKLFYDMISKFIERWRTQLDIRQRASSIKHLLFFAMLCALFVPFYLTGKKVEAQTQGGVTITAQSGFHGRCESGKWKPIHVTVENKGADIINARVQVSYTNSLSGQTTNGIDISLPATSRKEFFLYDDASERFDLTHNAIVSVLDGNKTLAKTNLI